MSTKRQVGACLMVLALLLFAIGCAYIRSAEKALLEGHVISSNGTCTHDHDAVWPFSNPELII